MQKHARVLITDSFTKHALGIAKYYKKANPSVCLVGVHSQHIPSLVKWIYYRYYDEIIIGELPDALKSNPDFVIAVWASSVHLLSKQAYKKTVIPSIDLVEICLDKYLTYQAAVKAGVPAPFTCTYKEFLALETVSGRFVLKQRSELDKAPVYYFQGKEELEQLPISYKETAVVQQYVKGEAIGFFALYQEGKLLRYYIHRRIREYPQSGGPSVAAETIFIPSVLDAGKRLLDELKWHGVAMVEFKYDTATDTPYVIEINPKFWGSTELGLAAGINFGDLLWKMYRTEQLLPQGDAPDYKRIRFYWPLDNDWKALLLSRNWKGLLAYLKPGYYSNLSVNYILFKLSRIVIR